MDPRRKPEIDRLTELANIGAGHAAGALAQIVGKTIWTDVPVVFDPASGAALDSTSAARPQVEEARVGEGERSCTGVFFDFEGCLEAHIGILFPGASSEALVRRLVGIESGELSSEFFESALMEVGNILASHVASAIADTLHERLLPSIPTLAMESADFALASWLEDRVGPNAPRIESGLHDEANELRGRLVFVPAGSFD